jgi:hypothetical protein
VRDRIAHHRECLGMTHLIARGQIPDVAPERLEESLRLFATLRP